MVADLKKKGLFIPFGILETKELKLNQKIVLSQLLSKSNKYAYPNQNYLSKYLGISKSTVQRCIKSLKELGYIEVSYESFEGMDTTKCCITDKTKELINTTSIRNKIESKNDKNSFKFKREYFEAIDILEDVDCREWIYFALCDYALNGNDTTDFPDDFFESIFKLLKFDVDHERECNLYG
ncbi:MAG: helix-turn-helix domain-containing protein [Coprobacillus sp.]|nr:helix-turn-helix domain-containing protein [Coprobacillus sp.]